MNEPWPSFEDPFIESVATSFARRRRALSQRGDFSARAEHADLLIVIAVAYSRRAVILAVAPRNMISLYVRSTARSDRGRVLTRIEGLRVVGNGERIVEVFERTLAAVKGSEGYATIDADIVSRWQRLALGAVAPAPE